MEILDDLVLAQLAEKVFAKERLQSLMAEERKGGKSEWVFPAPRSASGHMENPKKHWAALLKATDLENLRIHDLRRSLGSWAAMSGASLTIIGRALGHKSVDATQIYARLQVDPVRAAMELATSQMLGRGGYKTSAEVIQLEKRGGGGAGK